MLEVFGELGSRGQLLLAPPRRGCIDRAVPALCARKKLLAIMAQWLLIQGAAEPSGGCSSR